MRRGGLSDLNKDASSRPLSFVINRFLAPRIVEAWIKIRHQHEVADRCLATLARRDRLGSRDRRRLAEAIFTALRRRGSVDAILGAKAHDVKYSQLWLATALANDWPDGPKALPFVEHDHPTQAGNLPPLIIQKLKGSTIDLLKLGCALRQRAPVTIRCIPGQRDQLARTLLDNNVRARPTPYAPHGLICEDGSQLHGLDQALRGTFEIQDEGSQLLAMLVGARAHERVLDACAGAGGKTLALLHSNAHITSSDINNHRLERLRKRLGSYATQVTIANLSKDEDSMHAHAFDRVLLDVPCSGTGTARRAPDLMWRLTPTQLDQYISSQKSLLNRYAGWVRPGGYLIYGTCSVLPQENEDQITDFLLRHPEFKRVPVAQTLGHELSDRLQCIEHLQLMPHQHHTDGFYGCLMQRHSELNT